MFHHRRPFFSRKLIFLGATLWLTSTVLAGVRRATGYTHAAMLSDESKRRQAYLRMLDMRFRHARALPEQHELDQMFVETAQSPEEKEQRRVWIEKEKTKVAQQGELHSALDRPFWREQQHYHHRDGCGNHGFMRWYLGVGERTFDWFVRKVKGSDSFQWQDPTAGNTN
ncbi:hypothetical protein GGI15_001710 [Coemansia interrupta]|uniref:Uncharacterized protein n=1 Tax=Coemansia interrupta TaxID=1126814 RepID=A0A9W8HHL6_9FUNG|nr:hypothetical protein GGI15_001710 [Coemansia interrupta]